MLMDWLCACWKMHKNMISFDVYLIEKNIRFQMAACGKILVI